MDAVELYHFLETNPKWEQIAKKYPKEIQNYNFVSIMVKLLENLQIDDINMEKFNLLPFHFRVISLLYTNKIVTEAKIL